MSPRTQVFLYKLLWGAELILRPQYRHVIESYEAWACRRGYLRTIRRLEELGLIETLTRRRPDDTPVPDRGPRTGTRAAIHRIHRLTHTGRITALGGMDPELRWNRPWDGLWRMIHFDIPEEENSARARLRRALRDRGFGYLQKSLWISPFPLDSEIIELAAPGGDVEAVFSMAGRPAAGETDEAIVAGAWDFARVNQLYEECLEVLENPPEPNFHSGRQAQAMVDWIRREHRAWQAVLKKDPFLPSALLPPGYLGRKVWELRSQLPGRDSFPRPPAPPAPAPHRASQSR